MCDYETHVAIDLDCSAVRDDNELQQVFRSNIPFTKFRKLTILGDVPNLQRVHITTLDRVTFQNVSFSSFEIGYTDLTTITTDAFYDSMSELEEMSITDSFIKYFPFNMLVNCPNLKTLHVDHNELIHMSPIVSANLLYLDVSYNPSLTYEDNAFYEAPTLEYLHLNDIGLTHVAADTFYNQVNLKFLDLDHNNLGVLMKDALRFTNTPPHIEQVKLDGNQIHMVEPLAIAGQ